MKIVKKNLHFAFLFFISTCLATKNKQLDNAQATTLVEPAEAQTSSSEKSPSETQSNSTVEQKENKGTKATTDNQKKIAQENPFDQILKDFNIPHKPDNQKKRDNTQKPRQAIKKNYTKKNNFDLRKHLQEASEKLTSPVKIVMGLIAACVATYWGFNKKAYNNKPDQALSSIHNQTSPPPNETTNLDHIEGISPELSHFIRQTNSGHKKNNLPFLLIHGPSNTDNSFYADMAFQNINHFSAIHIKDTKDFTEKKVQAIFEKFGEGQNFIKVLYEIKGISDKAKQKEFILNILKSNEVSEEKLNQELENILQDANNLPTVASKALFIIDNFEDLKEDIKRRLFVEMNLAQKKGIDLVFVATAQNTDALNSQFIHKNKFTTINPTPEVKKQQKPTLQAIVQDQYLGKLPDQEVEILVDSLTNPNKYSQKNLKTKEVWLFTGQSGTGKTALARHIAHKASIPTMSLNPSRLLKEYAKNGLASIDFQKIFSDAAKKAMEDNTKKIILIFDDIDSLGKDFFGLLLDSMDNFKLDKINIKEQIIVIVTSKENAPESLYNNNRFKIVELTSPDKEDRTLLIDTLSKKYNLEPTFNHSALIELTGGMPSGFIIEGFEQSALTATFQGHDLIPYTILEKTFTDLKVKNAGNMPNLTTPLVTFDDYIGTPPSEIENILKIASDPDYYAQYGIELPKGIMLHGPPGTGKTLLAQALANKLRYSFFAINGAEWKDKWVGQEAKGFRQLVMQAEKVSPSIIFIDECDALLGRINESADSMVNDDRKSTRAMVLSHVDGIRTNKRSATMFILATNRPDDIDPAVLRPGRIQERIEISLPNQEDYLKLVNYHMNNTKRSFSSDINPQEIAQECLKQELSPAFIKYLFDQAALYRANDYEDNKKKIITPIEKCHMQKALESTKKKNEKEQFEKWREDHKKNPKRQQR